MADEYMVITAGSAEGKRFELGQEITMGRDTANHVPLDDTQASRRHAKLSRASGALVLEDLGSTNGTFVNGERVSGSRALAAGDEIRIGRTLMSIRADAVATELGQAPPGPAGQATIPVEAVAPPPAPPQPQYQQQQPPPPAPPPPAQYQQQGQGLARPDSPHGYPEPPPAAAYGGRLPGERDAGDGLAGLKSDSQVRFRAYLVTFVVLALVALAVILFIVVG